MEKYREKERTGANVVKLDTVSSYVVTSHVASCDTSTYLVLDLFPRTKSPILVFCYSVLFFFK